MIKVEDFGLVGPSYTAPMLLQGAEECINWYVEVADSGSVKMPAALLGTPGLNPVLSQASLPVDEPTTNVSLVEQLTGPVRGLHVFPGGMQALMVVGSGVYIVNGTNFPSEGIRLSATRVGQLTTSEGPVSIADNGNAVGQVAVTDADNGEQTLEFFRMALQLAGIPNPDQVQVVSEFGKGGYAVIVDGMHMYYYLLSGVPTVISQNPSQVIITDYTASTGLTGPNGQTIWQVSFPDGIPDGLVIAQGIGALGPVNNAVVAFLAGFRPEGGTAFQSLLPPDTVLYVDPTGNTLTIDFNALTMLIYSLSGTDAAVDIPPTPDPTDPTTPTPTPNPVYNMQLVSGTTDGAIIGYSQDVGIGSLTPDTLTDGLTVTDLVYIPTPAIPQNNALEIAIAGYTADPGIGFITEMTVTDSENPSITITLQGSDADHYFYGPDGPNGLATLPPGVANWVWTNSGFTLESGRNYNVSLTTGTGTDGSTGGGGGGTVTSPVDLSGFGILINPFGMITDPAAVQFGPSSRVDFFEGWFIFNQIGSRLFFTNAPEPYTITFSGLFYALADNGSDNLITLQINQGELFLFTEYRMECWINSGGTTFAWTRLGGVAPQTGCSAPFSLARMGVTLVWLGRNEQGENTVLQQSGYAGVRISTHAMEEEISKYPEVSDAVAYTYDDAGHLFYVITFPSADVTWVFDDTSSEKFGYPCWHKRLSSDMNGQYHRHRSNCFMNMLNTRIVGDYQSGQLHHMSREFFTDAGMPIRCLRRTRHIWAPTARTRVFLPQLQLEFTPGVGTTQGQGFNPKAMLRWSSDGGFSWSREYWAPIGKTGETRNRCMFRQLGYAWDRVFEVSFSDPVPRDIIGCTLYGEPEASAINME